MIVLEIVFIVLVAADTIITYMVIESGKGRESAFAKLYIKNVPLTIAITIAGTGIILLLISLSHMYWLLGPLCLVFGFACWRSWRILK